MDHGTDSDPEAAQMEQIDRRRKPSWSGRRPIDSSEALDYWNDSGVASIVVAASSGCVPLVAKSSKR